MAARFDTVVAKKHLAAHIMPFRSLSHVLLADKGNRGDIETYETAEPNGASYPLEILFRWGGKPDADI
jgi:hypothetical protein